MTWIFDAEQFVGAYFLEYTTNIILYMMSPVIGGLMLSYVDYSIFKNRQRLAKKKFYMHLSVVTGVILIINHFVPIYFKVNPATNRYSSGDFQFVHYLMILGLYTYMVFFLFRNRNRTAPYVIQIFSIFFMLPVLGMLVQIVNSRIHFSWTSIVLGCLVAYTFLESTTTEQDYLTKIYNRKSYEAYVEHLIESKRPFGIVLIDLNRFKEINDLYGHHEGDLVLIEFAKALEKVFNKKSLVSRLGGDEFVIVVEDTYSNLDQKIESVYNHLAHNSNKNIQNLTFSYGLEIYQSNMTLDTLYKVADQKMYHQKSRSS
jgi:diguanylate cyclase (GGDEF)-like protein